MYIGRGTVQVTLGADTDAMLFLTEDGTKRLADTLSRATAEMATQP